MRLATLLLVLLLGAGPLTVDDLITLKGLGYSEEEIKAEVDRTGSRFQLGEAEIARLRRAGFGEGWIHAMKGGAGGGGAEGYRSLDTRGAGGMALVARREGVRKATALAGAVLRDLGARFDAPPRAEGGMRDREDRECQITFVAARGGRAWRGILSVSVAGEMATVGVACDEAALAPRSLSRLLAIVAAETAKGQGGEVRLTTTPFPDGSGVIDLPPGWRVTGSHKGMCEIEGPEGEMGFFGFVYPVLMPGGPMAVSNLVVASMPADPADAITEVMPLIAEHIRVQVPAAPRIEGVRIVEKKKVPFPTGPAATVVWEAKIGGKEYRAFSLVALLSAGGEFWHYYESRVATPVSLFDAELPMLSRIWQSWKIDPRVIRERLQKARETQEEANRIFDETMRRRAAVEDATHEKWIEVIRGEGRVRDVETGDVGTVALPVIEDVVRAANDAEGYERWQVIRPGEISAAGRSP